MLLQTVSVDLVGILLTVAILVAVVVYSLILKKKAHHEKRRVNAVSLVIREYFRKSGLDVAASSVSLDGGKSFTAFIESEPMKRFRLSHIIEATLRDQVQKSCGLLLDKVYWRFPIKDAERAVADMVGLEKTGKEEKQDVASAAIQSLEVNTANSETDNKEAKKDEETDNYINEGLVHYKNLPTVEVTELSWENFEALSSSAAKEKKTPE